VGVGQRVQVLLCRLDLTVPQAVHHGLEVGSAREQPGRMGVAQIVDPHVEAKSARVEGWQPVPRSEGVAAERVTAGALR